MTRARHLTKTPSNPLDFNPVTRPPAPLWTSAPLQGDRHAPESVIGMAELVIGIGGIRNGATHWKMGCQDPFQKPGEKPPSAPSRSGFLDVHDYVHYDVYHFVYSTFFRGSKDVRTQ